VGGDFKSVLSTTRFPENGVREEEHSVGFPSGLLREKLRQKLRQIACRKHSKNGILLRLNP
jgi:hypothetical protein